MSAPNPRKKRISRRVVRLAVLAALVGAGIVGVTYQAMANDLVWTIGNY